MIMSGSYNYAVNLTENTSYDSRGVPDISSYLIFFPFSLYLDMEVKWFQDHILQTSLESSTTVKLRNFISSNHN